MENGRAKVFRSSSQVGAPKTSENGAPKRIDGKLQLGELLGRGAFGRVYKGLNYQTGEIVAVKQILKTDLEPSQLPAIMHELQLLQSLSHPHIVKFLSYHEVDDYLFFVMEYVENGSLHETMKKFGVFPEELLVLYVAQVLHGLKYLHDQKVIHRDIKGCNLLLTKEGEVKLADFGSCTNAAVDKQFTVVGTPFWMAPEIISVEGGEKVSDIWSLGCTIIELLTGKPPYWDAGAMSALFKMVACAHPPLPPDISDELRDFLLKCFIRDVKLRPGPQELLQHPWISKNIHPEKKQTPSTAEIHRTIREYNSTKRTPTVADIIWTPENGNDRDINSPGKPLLPSNKDVEELVVRCQKLTEENSTLVREKATLEDKLDDLEKRVEKQAAEMERLQERLVRTEKDCEEYRKRLKGGGGGSKAKIPGKRLSSGFLQLASSPERQRAHSSGSVTTASSNSKEKEGIRNSSTSTSDRERDKEKEVARTSSAGEKEKKGRPGSESIPLGQLELRDSSSAENVKGPQVLRISDESVSTDSPGRKRRTPRLCAACAKPIVRDGRLAMGKPWHHDCFKCSHCQAVLDEFIEREGRPLCVNDFNALYSNRCGGCGEIIKGQYIQAMNRFWHAGHFRCCVCNTNIQGGFVERGDKPLCSTCFKAAK